MATRDRATFSFWAAAGAPGASWPPMATCDLPSAASRWGAPRAFGQRGSAKHRTQKGCAQHKHAREHRARARWAGLRACAHHKT